MARPNPYGRKKITIGTRRALIVASGFTCARCGWKPSRTPENYDGRMDISDRVQSGWQPAPFDFSSAADSPARVPRMIYRNLEVDHILPVKHGGTNERSNLQVLCSICNASKGAGI